MKYTINTTKCGEYEVLSIPLHRELQTVASELTSEPLGLNPRDDDELIVSATLLYYYGHGINTIREGEYGYHVDNLVKLLEQSTNHAVDPQSALSFLDRTIGDAMMVNNCIDVVVLHRTINGFLPMAPIVGQHDISIRFGTLMLVRPSYIRLYNEVRKNTSG